MKLKGKKVLVTGACGFIGSHLAERLVQEGCKVRAFVFYNSFNSWGWLDAIDRKKLHAMEIFAGDVRDPNGVKESMKGVDAVFHLAALIGIPFSYHSPDSYVDTNVKGTLNILQSARDSKVERVIATSTSEVYGTARYVPIDENHPLQAQSPYSASKIAADKIAESFHLSFGSPVIIARPFNTYGPRQSARAVVPTVISQAMLGSGPIKLGSLFPTRDMNYIYDICEGFVKLAECDAAVGKTVNICSGTEISVGGLADKILKLMHSGKRIAKDKARVRPAKSEVERLMGDNTLLTSLTGWKPRYNLDKGLSETIKWFRDKDSFRRYKGSIYNI